jgi:L-asparaginase/Glu-tRNA(Gln) amidotransferase subunit D
MAEKATALEAHRAGWLTLPPGYELEHGADVLLLRRADGSVAATFGAGSATPAVVARTAEADHRMHGRSTA